MPIYKVYRPDVFLSIVRVRADTEQDAVKKVLEALADMVVEETDYHDTLEPGEYPWKVVPDKS